MTINGGWVVFGLVQDVDLVGDLLAAISVHGERVSMPFQGGLGTSARVSALSREIQV